MSFVHGPLSQGHEIRILGTLEDEGSREVCAWIIYGLNPLQKLIVISITTD